MLEGIPERDAYFYEYFALKIMRAGNVILLKLALVQKKIIYEISCFTTSGKHLIFATYIRVCLYVPCKW
jgi:hypothetical protein